jgi:hypothetical protein
VAKKEAPPSKIQFTHEVKGPRKVEGDELGVDYYDITVHLKNCKIVHHMILPTTHPPDIKYEKKVTDKVDTIHDAVSVPAGTSRHIAEMAIEEKMKDLAKRLEEDHELEYHK